MFHTALDFNDKISIVNRHRAGKQKVKNLLSQILIQSVHNAKGETGNLLRLLTTNFSVNRKVCVGKSMSNRGLHLEI